MTLRLRRRPSRPAVSIGVRDPEGLTTFFDNIGWSTVDGIVTTPGGRFAVHVDDAPPRYELALSVPDALDVDALHELVEPAGGILMEPLQETAWGGWGFSFNDPAANVWEIGAPWTVTAVDRAMTYGVRPAYEGPIVALAVPVPRR